MTPQRKRHGGEGECLKVGVSRDACYVRFGLRLAVVAYSQRPDFKTARGDDVILDFDSEGRLIGIELLGNKPCQRLPDAMPATAESTAPLEEKP